MSAVLNIMSFVNKVVLVTGGSSGIGAATAIAFTKEGASVAVVGRNEEKLNSVVEKCALAGKKPLSIKADITKEAERIVKETIEAFGVIDVLVNNAGLVRLSQILDSHVLETYDIVMNTNLRAQIHLTHLVGPFLIKSKGNIVNISSVGPKIKAISTAESRNIIYSTSKAAFTYFSRAAAAEFATHGVRVNTVSPGPVDTDIMSNAGINKSFSEMNVQDLLPLGRLPEPVEIADVILFLASDRAKCVTGAEYVIDSGFLLKL